MAARIAAVLLVCLLGTSTQLPSSDATVGRVFAHAAYRQATAALDAGFPRFVDDLVALTETPAPAFAEDRRADLLIRLLREAGLPAAARDEEGNVVAVRRGRGGPLLAISAHLDTVFPPETDVRVRRDGSRLMAPGIGDDSQGLATLVALARALTAARIETTRDVVFVGTVGEEAKGNLRGVRHLFEKSRFKGLIREFVSIDGVGDGRFITVGAVASRRYRVSFDGPGGHSYGAFGLVNPANALAGAITALSRIDVPTSPRTTFNVGMVGGGTSVNAIPSSTWMEVDLRSEAPAELDRLDERFRQIVADAAATENRARSAAQGPVTVHIDQLGERPGGETSARSKLVMTAAAVCRTLGLAPVFGRGSTDANLPMSLGIPAITIDSGIPGGRPHSPDEWISVEKTQALAGLQRSLLLLLSLAGPV